MKQAYNIAIIGSVAQSAINFRSDFIAYLCQQGHKVYVFCNDYTPTTRQYFIDLGACPIDSPLNRSSLNPFKDIIATYRLTKQLKSKRIDVMLCHFVKSVVFGVFSAYLAGVKQRTAMLEGLGWAFTHRPVKSSYKLVLIKWIQLMLYSVSFPLTHQLIFLNNDDANTLRRYVKLPPVHILGGIGVTDAFFRATKPPTLDPVTFIFIGRLLVDKGINEFLSAAKAVKKQCPTTRFIVVGDIDIDNPASLSREDFIQLKADDKCEIEFVGSTTQVINYLLQSSVLVLPSYREGFSRVVQEAMAVGRAVIVSDTPGCRQAVIQGVNGFVVPPFSSEAIKEKMLYFIRQPDKIIEMGQLAHNHATTHFYGPTVAKRLATLINLNFGSV